MWERTLLDRKSRHGSRVRYTTILPALLILLLIVLLSSHWFSKPGNNSTFMRTGGNGAAVELLYGSARGWRFLDAGFKPGDSLTFAIRDGGKYAIRIYGIYPGMPEPVAVEIWKSPGEQRYGSRDLEPVFSSSPREVKANPRYFAVVYDTASLDQLNAEEVPGLLHDGSGGGRMPSFHYQVFRVPDAAR
jgi:hypothetical protein